MAIIKWQDQRTKVLPCTPGSLALLSDPIGLNVFASFWLLLCSPKISVTLFELLLFQSPETTEASWASYSLFLAMTAVSLLTP